MFAAGLAQSYTALQRRTLGLTGAPAKVSLDQAPSYLGTNGVIHLRAGVRTDIFKGTAYYYARFRPGYPQRFFDLLGESFQLDGTGRLLDLGCGTGQIAVPLASLFAHVVAMDPEPEMLAEAQRHIKEAGVGNVSLIEGASSDLPDLMDSIGKFRLVAMGSSFHWMNRAATLDILSRMVEPGGGIAVASAGSLWTADAPWCRAVKATVQRWLGDERRAGSSTYAVPPERHEALIARSAFGPCKNYVFTYQQDWTVDQVVGYLYSTSFCSPHVLGERRAGFEEDLRQTLLRLDPDGHYVEDVSLDVCLGFLSS
jgi:SAM-dependent methyltransferase